MSAEKNLEKLPEYCYAVSDFSKELIVLKRGVPGYFPTNISTSDAEENRAMADYMNSKLGVSKAQAQAMFVGSLFGWHVPGADPSMYEQRSQARPTQEQDVVFHKERDQSANLDTRIKTAEFRRNSQKEEREEDHKQSSQLSNPFARTLL